MPRYAPRDGLSQLARYFYEDILPHIRDAKEISAATGLPSRLVEDVLVELLTWNCILLDFSPENGHAAEIRLQHQPVHTTPPTKPMGSIDVWQDQYTGAILPVQMIEDYAPVKQPIGKHTSLINPAGGLSRDHEFITASDAWILSVLKTTAPDYLFLSEDRGYALESLTEKTPRGPMTMYLPINEVKNENRNFRVIEAPLGLPWWLIRLWSRKLAVSDPDSQTHRTLNGISFPEEESVFQELDEVRLARNWCRQFAQPPSETWAPLEASLREKLHVSLKQAGEYRISIDKAADGSNHLREMAAATRNFLLLVVHGESQARTVVEVVKSIRGNATWPLILVDDSKADAQTNGSPAVGATEIGGNRVVLVEANGGLNPTMCIRDGIEVRLGSLAQLQTSSPMMRVEGRLAIQDVFVPCINEVLPDNGGGWWVKKKINSKSSHKNGDWTGSDNATIDNTLAAIQGIGEQISKLEKTRKDGQFPDHGREFQDQANVIPQEIEGATRRRQSRLVRIPQMLAREAINDAIKLCRSGSFVDLVVRENHDNHAQLGLNELCQTLREVDANAHIYRHPGALPNVDFGNLGVSDIDHDLPSMMVIDHQYVLVAPLAGEQAQISFLTRSFNFASSITSLLENLRQRQSS